MARKSAATGSTKQRAAKGAEATREGEALLPPVEVKVPAGARSRAKAVDEAVAAVAAVEASAEAAARAAEQEEEAVDAVVVRVRRLHRRDLNRAWEFLKMCFRDVNRDTVEYQRPRSKRQFLEVYDEDGIEQIVFETDSGDMVGYAECAVEIIGSDNWINERYFAKRDMRPLFVEELAVHPGYQGRGIGGFVLEQLEHLAKVRGCTHLVLEVAENNQRALLFYRGRAFYKLDAAVFMAKKLAVTPDLLPPRSMVKKKRGPERAGDGKAQGEGSTGGRASAPPPSPRSRAKRARGN